jgi:hypothetical protein
MWGQLTAVLIQTISKPSSRRGFTVQFFFFREWCTVSLMEQVFWRQKAF